MVSFSIPLTFSDGPTATVCGFCLEDRLSAVTGALRSLDQTAFGSLREGLLIDRRFIRLLREVLEPERDCLYLVGGSIRADGADAPCGAVLGDLFAPPRSASAALDTLRLPDGQTLRLLLKPGEGGAVFSCTDRTEEEELYVFLAQTFPAPPALERLEQNCPICLYALDYAPGDPRLNGSCFVQLKKNHAEGR